MTEIPRFRKLLRIASSNNDFPTCASTGHNVSCRSLKNNWACTSWEWVIHEDWREYGTVKNQRQYRSRYTYPLLRRSTELGRYWSAIVIWSLWGKSSEIILTRCFCPPLKLIPFSPISVWSPSGSASRSGRRQAFSIARQYLSLSNLWPKMILFLWRPVCQFIRTIRKYSTHKGGILDPCGLRTVADTTPKWCMACDTSHFAYQAL